MNTDYAPSEIASYIVRRPEEGTVKQKEKSKYRKLWISGAWCIALAMVLACSWYGIARQAAAHDEAEISVQTVATVDAEAATQEAARSKAEAQTTVMQKVQEQEVVTSDAEAQETKIQEAATQTQNPVGILSGEELLSYIAKQEVTADHEENLTGLLWNYELIADIQNRIAAAEAEAELFCDEDYRELLVTMGMDSDYVSQDPELPKYLTKTYNPQMDIELTDEELSALLRLVEAEAPAEDIYGKILVANVVLNRVNHDEMANSVIGVVYEKVGGAVQFSPTAINWYWNSIKVTDSTREAVARCLSGEDYSDGALYFYAWERDPDKHETLAWMSDLDLLFTHGGHRFLR